MALSDGIRAPRDRVLADLGAAHDYYIDTEFAWRIVMIRKVVTDVANAAISKLP